MNSISICNTSIREFNGLYSLNDLHQASGGQDKHSPRRWLQNQQTIEFANECEKDGIPSILKKQGLGTFVCKELVIHYAMWISPSFSLQVIQHFLNSLSGSLPLQQPQLPAEYFAHLAKMAHYAEDYQKIQSLLCTDPYGEQAQKLMTSFNYSTNSNQTGYLFVFKPNIQQDVKQAFDFLYQYSQKI